MLRLAHYQGSHEPRSHLIEVCTERDAAAACVQEVLCAPQVYDGKAADVWSCAVHLYIMLVGWYPFTDPREPKNFSKTASNITRVRYAFPSGLQISDECKELIKRMFVRDPNKRITIPEIQAHPWYRKNLSREMAVRACPAAAGRARLSRFFEWSNSSCSQVKRYRKRGQHSASQH